VVTESETLAVLEGGYGFGQTLGEQAVDLGVEKAKKHGVSVIGLRNAGHLGRIGDWPERAAAQGLVSVHFVNATGRGLLVAPYGGVERRMSTNPFAVGVPVEDGPPLILDFATSVVAEGKVMVAVDGGKPLPEGALVAADGTLTTDAEVIYGPITSARPLDPTAGRGAMRAMGEHKGSGLAIVCELLAGALTGGGCARPGEVRILNNMLSIYMDLAAFDAGGGFAAEVHRYVAYACSAKPIDPEAPVMMPGEPERRTREARLVNGIVLPDTTWSSIVEVAQSLGLDRAAIEAG
jgi:uncharacterized oxidoreductase